MADVISLKAARAKRDGPDAEHVQVIDGVSWYRFTCSFDFDGREFCLDIWARDLDDARARMTALRDTGRVDGQVYMSGDV